MTTTASTPRFQDAIAHALHRLHTELPSLLVYHDPDHTELGVLPASQQLARMLGVSGRDRMLLATAAAYHDLGFIDQVTGHELHSVTLARAALPAFAFSEADIEYVAGMILATRLPQAPKTLLEAILADADLDVLGRGDFPQHSEALRAETANLGTVLSDAAWSCRQLEFFRAHRYFTAAARQLRDAGKRRNEQWLRERCLPQA